MQYKLCFSNFSSKLNYFQEPSRMSFPGHTYISFWAYNFFKWADLMQYPTLKMGGLIDLMIPLWKGQVGQTVSPYNLRKVDVEHWIS